MSDTTDRTELIAEIQANLDNALSCRPGRALPDDPRLQLLSRAAAALTNAQAHDATFVEDLAFAENSVFNLTEEVTQLRRELADKTAIINAARAVMSARKAAMGAVICLPADVPPDEDCSF